MLTESSSSEEKDGSVSRFLLSSSSRRLHGEGQLLSARPPSPSVSPNGGGVGGGGGGGGGDKGRMPPFTEGSCTGLDPSMWSGPDEGFFSVFRKSRKDVMKPDFSSDGLSSV